MQMLMTIINFTRHIFRSKKGQGMVEYGLIIGLIAVAVIVVLTTMGGQIRALFQSVVDALTGAAAGSGS